MITIYKLEIRGEEIVFRRDIYFSSPWQASLWAKISQLDRIVIQQQQHHHQARGYRCVCVCVVGHVVAKVQEDPALYFTILPISSTLS